MLGLPNVCANESKSAYRNLYYISRTEILDDPT